MRPTGLALATRHHLRPRPPGPAFSPHSTLTARAGTSGGSRGSPVSFAAPAVDPSPLPISKLTVTKLSRSEAQWGLILDGVSFCVPPGQLFGLIGPSGSGKSTLLRALNRLWEPPHGTVHLDGVDVRQIPVQQLRVRMGMVFQSPNLFEGSVEFNVQFGPWLRGVRLSVEEIEQLLLRAGLQPSTQLLKRSVNELSVGEAQRVSLARALANSPEVLLMDEPTSSLDPSATRRVEETIARLQHAEGLTVVLVSHSMVQVERLAQMAGLLSNGRLVAVGAPSELRESENPVVASFFTGELD